MDNGIPRRDFLKAAGIAAAGLGSWPLAQEKSPMGATETLDALLDKNRKRDAARGVPGGSTNHVPMTLIALHKMGAGAAQMQRYFDRSDKPFEPRASRDEGEGLTAESWQEYLGKAGEFHRYLGYFEARAKQTSAEAVLKESVSILMKGAMAHAYHPLLRLGYAIDIGDKAEMVYALAHWAATWCPSPDYDTKSAPVEADALFSDIVKATSTLDVDAGQGIGGRAEIVYRSESFSKQLKPVRFSVARPTDQMAEFIAEAFTKTQDFTLLHAVTSCQAVRLILPYASDPGRSLGEFWHAVIAAYVSVARQSKIAIGKDTAPGDGLEWKDVFAKAAEGDPKAGQSAYEHTVKLVYSCSSEFGHFKSDRYLALASREVVKPSRFK